MTDEPIPETLALGLDLFAAAWLQQWCDAGGSVQLTPDGKALIGYPEYWSSPSYVEPTTDCLATDQMQQHSRHDAQFQGRMTALMDHLEVVPFGREALKRHMRAHGLAYCAGKGEAS